MREMFSTLSKNLGPIISRMLVAFRQELSNLVALDSPKFGPATWEIARRSWSQHILIHAGNTAHDVIGCVAVGMGVFGQLQGVSNSRKAIENLIPDDEQQDNGRNHDQGRDIVLMGILGQLFGSEKVMDAAIGGITKGFDALVYTDEEKAGDAAKERSEAQINDR
jgi:hypothetical protein